MPAPPLQKKAFQLLDWTVRPRANELARGDAVLHVEPKVMALLLTLVERADETVTREELMAAVWPGLIVSEDALSQAVSKLRSALGDDAQNPRFVETIPKVGYRLVAPVMWDEYASDALPKRKATWRTGLLVGAGVVLLGALLVLALRPRPDLPEPDIRTLTHLPGVETHPAFSLDGHRLAFVAAPRDGPDAFDLYVQSLSDPNPLRLTETPEVERHPVWLPDERLAFLRCTGTDCALYTVPSLGGGARRLTPARLGRWGLTADAQGQALIATARTAPGAPYRLVHIAVTTGNLTYLTDPPADTEGDLYPAVSPDGRTVAFARLQGDGETKVFLQPLDSDASPRALVDDAGTVLGMAWAARGETLLVASERNGVGRLWRVALDGGVSEPLRFTAVVTPRYPALDADRLVFEGHKAEVDLYAADLASGDGLTPVVVSTNEDTQPHLHPEGDRVAFVSDRSGGPAIWVARLDRSELVRLVDLDGAWVGAPRWSPDGRWIVFEGQNEEMGVLYRVAAEGGPATRLTDSAGYDFGPRWGPDGRFVYFGSNRGGRPGVWRVPAGGGTPTRLTDGLGGEPTRGGDTLVFVRRDQPGLWMQPLTGGAVTRLDATLAPADWGNWALTDAGIVLVERTVDGARVVRLDPTSGERATILDSLGGIPDRVPALTATPDGRRLVLARIVHNESALILAAPFE